MPTILARLFAAAEYPPDAADLRAIWIAGMRLPLRATVAIAATILLVIFDFQRTFIPDHLVAYDRNPGMQRLQALDRLVLFLVVPLLIVVAGFRDRPSRYGLRLGDWRLGLGLAVVGAAVMTPLVLVLATLPDFRAFYAPSATGEPLPSLLFTNVVDLVSTEFLYRGFLMFTLIRVFGPLGMLVMLFPFTLTHLTKPELELLSTLFGGAVYGWVAWRTGSILWGAVAHVWIVTVVMVASAASG